MIRKNSLYINILLSAVVLAGTTAEVAYADTATYDWSGFYVGVNTGKSYAKDDFSVRTIDPASFGGERGPESASIKWNGFIGGAQIGYNWMTAPNVVLGLEAALSAPDLKLNAEGVSKYGISYKTLDIDTVATLRGRAGYAFNNWMIFGTGGVAWTHVRTSNTQGPCGDGNTPPSFSIGNCASGPFTAVPYGTKDTNSINKTGWTLGVGAEVGITPNWIARVEYIHTDFRSFNAANPSFNRESTNKLKLDTAQIGLNYRFQ